MKQALLRFSLPADTALYATQFKDLIARACDKHPVVGESFFHYRNGQAISDAEPDIRFVGGKRWVGILSRSGDTATLLPVAGIAALELGKHCGKPVSMELLEPAYGVEITSYPVHYYYRDVVAKHANRWKGTNEDLVIRTLTERLRLERDRVMLDLPALDISSYRDEAFTRHLDHAADERTLLKERLGIEIHDLRRLAMPLETATGKTNTSVILLQGSFSMFAKLAGMWQMGSLQSRGYGRIIPVKGATAC